MPTRKAAMLLALGGHVRDRETCSDAAGNRDLTYQQDRDARGRRGFPGADLAAKIVKATQLRGCASARRKCALAGQPGRNHGLRLPCGRREEGSTAAS